MTIDRVSQLKDYEEKQMVLYDEQILELQNELKQIQLRIEQLFDKKERLRLRIQEEINEILTGKCSSRHRFFIFSKFVPFIRFRSS